MHGLQVSGATTAPTLLTVRQVADQLGVSSRLVWRLIAEGRLGRVNVGRCVRVPATSVADFIAKGRAMIAINAVDPSELIVSAEAQRILRNHSWALKRRPGFARECHDDVHANLQAAVWQRLCKRPIPVGCGLQYVRRAVRSAAVSYIRAVEAVCRSIKHEAGSLNSPVPGNASMEFGDTIAARQNRDVDTELDVRDLLEAADPVAKAMAMGFMAGSSRSEQARECGVPRSSTYSNLRSLRLWLNSLDDDDA